MESIESALPLHAPGTLLVPGKRCVLGPMCDLQAAERAFVDPTLPRRVCNRSSRRSPLRKCFRGRAQRGRWSGTVAVGCGDELPELVDRLFAELDLEAVLVGDLLLAVIADRVGIQPPLADPLAAQLARESVGVSNHLECSAEPLLARDVVLGAHPYRIISDRAGALDDEDVAVGLEHFGPPEFDNPPRPRAFEEDVVGPDMRLVHRERVVAIRARELGSLEGGFADMPDERAHGSLGGARDSPSEPRER